MDQDNIGTCKNICIFIVHIFVLCIKSTIAISYDELFPVLFLNKNKFNECQVYHQCYTQH